MSEYICQHKMPHLHKFGVLVKNTELNVKDKHKDKGTWSVRACYKQMHPGSLKVDVHEGLSGLMEANF